MFHFTINFSLMDDSGGDLCRCLTSDGISEALFVCEMQERLFELTEESLDATVAYLCDSVFAQKKKRVHQFVTNFITAVRTRSNIYLYLHLFERLVQQSKDGQTFKTLKDSLLNMFPSPRKPAMTRFHFLKLILEAGIVTKEEIVEQIGSFYKRSPSLVAPWRYAFAWFVAAIADVDRSLYDGMLKVLSTPPKDGKIDQEMEGFLEMLPRLEENGWLLYEQITHDGYLHTTVEYDIAHDDSSKLAKRIEEKTVDVNARIAPGIYESNAMLRSYPTLLQFAAFHKAKKCFRLLVEHEADLTAKDNAQRTLSAYAVAAGDMEILAYLGMMELPTTNVVPGFTVYHHNALVKGMIGSDPKRVADPKSEFGTLLHNAALSNNIPIALYCLEHGTDVNILDSVCFSFINTRHHFTMLLEMDTWTLHSCSVHTRTLT